MKKLPGKKPVKKKVKKKPVKKKDKSLAKRSKSKPPSKNAGLKLSVDTHIQTALKSKTGIETLDKLLKMKYEHEAREAKKLFFINFSKMQGELPVIPMDKEVKSKAGNRLYSYASRGQITTTIRQCITNHGFSYHWTEEFPEERKIKIIFHFTGYGHTETCHIILPIMPKNDFVNDIQQTGSTSTYGKRYTMIDMLGVVAEEDNDGRSSVSQPAPPDSNMKNVTPAPEKKEKKEPAKQMLPENIGPDTLCTYGAFKDAPVKYGKIKIDKLFALRRLAGNPAAIEPVILHVLDAHIKHYKTLLKYKPEDMKEASKMHGGKENWLDTNCDERYKLMQALRNIERKLRPQNEKS